MINYQIGDFLIQIKNAALAKNREIVTRTTKLKLAVAKTLKKEGFISEVSEKGQTLTIKLAYQHKEPVLIDLKLVSKPGRRIYAGIAEIEKKKGPSILLMTTPQGVISSKQALKLRVGGEVIAEIW